MFSPIGFMKSSGVPGHLDCRPRCPVFPNRGSLTRDFAVDVSHADSLHLLVHALAVSVVTWVGLEVKPHVLDVSFRSGWAQTRT